MTQSHPAPAMRAARRTLLAAIAAAALLSPLAGGLAHAGETLLVVDGKIKGAAPRSFDMDALRQLPRIEFTTSTVWTEGATRFAGVALSDLLTAVGAQSDVLRLVAINDYAIDIPRADVAPGGAMIAYEMDGKPMSVRSKGPLWLVYPYDSNVAFRTEAIYARSIWQLVRIELRD